MFKITPPPFTEMLKQALLIAEKEATSNNLNFIGTEHLLIGLLSLEDSVAAKTLLALNINLEKVRSKAGETKDKINPKKIGLTANAKKTIEKAADQVRLLRHNYLGTEHLLLGLICEEKGTAAIILRSFNAELWLVRQTVMNLLIPGRKE